MSSGSFLTPNVIDSGISHGRVILTQYFIIHKLNYHLLSHKDIY